MNASTEFLLIVDDISEANIFQFDSEEEVYESTDVRCLQFDILSCISPLMSHLKKVKCKMKYPPRYYAKYYWTNVKIHFSYSLNCCGGTELGQGLIICLAGQTRNARCSCKSEELDCIFCHLAKHGQYLIHEQLMACGSQAVEGVISDGHTLSEHAFVGLLTEGHGESA